MGWLQGSSRCDHLRHGLEVLNMGDLQVAHANFPCGDGMPGMDGEHLHPVAAFMVNHHAACTITHVLSGEVRSRAPRAMGVARLHSKHRWKPTSQTVRSASWSARTVATMALVPPLACAVGV